MYITNARIITPDRIFVPGWLHSANGQIVAVGSGDPPPNAGQVVDVGGLTLIPGFIDVHVHGGNGLEAMDASADSLRELAAFYARHGVTAFLPTTWTAPHEQIMAALEAIKSLVGQPLDGADIAGAHVEGPYLNPVKCGAQDSRQIRRAGREEATELLDTGIVRLMALAPEYDENLWLIEECVRRGIAVSAAHTAATYADMQRAVKLGLSQSTHTFNAMTGLHHREPGTVGAALSMPQIACEIISDGIHVHPAVIQVLFAAKGADKIILITDAVRGAGLSDGSHYLQDGREVTIKEGSARLPDGTLAGSILTMNTAVRNFLKFTGTHIEDVWPVTSLNAARAVGLADRKGSLEVGKDADCVLVDDAMNVHMTIVGGRIVYRA